MTKTSFASRLWGEGRGLLHAQYQACLPVAVIISFEVRVRSSYVTGMVSVKSQLWSRISATDVVEAAARYAKYVSEDVSKLQERRTKSIPAAIHSRKSAGQPYLDKDELMDLVEWKSKQKSSPYKAKLIQLAAGNGANDVKQASQKAFENADEDIAGALKALSTLKGIGPATASLALSCYDLDRLPFFSDPLFRWIHLEDGTRDTLKGWEATIKYNVKEYMSLYERVEQLRERIAKDGQEISALQIEQAAYVFYVEREDSGGVSSMKGSKKRKQEALPSHTPTEKRQDSETGQDDKRPRSKKSSTASATARSLQRK